MNTQKPRNDSDGKGGAGLGGLLGGLSTIIERLGELAATGEALRRSGTFDHADGKVKGVYGFTIRTAAGGEGVKVEPFGNVHKDEETGRTVVAEVREPLVDVFDERDCVLVVAELPGIAAENVKLELHADVLTIVAEHGDSKYRREVLLPTTFAAGQMSWKCRNGVLEIRLTKPDAGSARTAGQ